MPISKSSYGGWTTLVSYLGCVWCCFRILKGYSQKEKKNLKYKVLFDIFVVICKTTFHGWACHIQWWRSISQKKQLEARFSASVESAFFWLLVEALLKKWYQRIRIFLFFTLKVTKELFLNNTNCALHKHVKMETTKTENC